MTAPAAPVPCPDDAAPPACPSDPHRRTPPDEPSTGPAPVTCPSRPPAPTEAPPRAAPDPHASSPPATTTAPTPEAADAPALLDVVISGGVVEPVMADGSPVIVRRRQRLAARQAIPPTPRAPGSRFAASITADAIRLTHPDHPLARAPDPGIYVAPVAAPFTDPTASATHPAPRPGPATPGPTAPPTTGAAETTPAPATDPSATPPIGAAAITPAPATDPAPTDPTARPTTGSAETTSAPATDPSAPPPTGAAAITAAPAADPAPIGPAAPEVATVTRPLTWPSLLQLSPDDRPRERLRRHGAETLTSAELLAVVLGTGAGAEDALQLARRALDTLGGVEALATATADDLIAVPGIGPGKAARIIAAFALAWRSVRVAAELDREAGLAALAPPESTIPDALRRVRGQVAGSERAVIGYHPRDAVPPITLALGETLGPRSRLGSYLARLLAEGTGPWWIIVVRPGRPARDIERQRAVDLLEAAHLVGVDLEHVLLLVGFEHRVLASTDPTLDPRSVPLTITPDPDDARPANTDEDPRAVTPATRDEEAAS